MAVHKRSYRLYEGLITPDWSRFLVPARYALETLYQSRLLLSYTVLCFLFPLIAILLVYLRHNLSAVELLGISTRSLITVNSDFFAGFLSVQGALAMFLTAYAGPGLISPDLRDNALPLYLCRPISRAEYVLGKLLVLCLPLSAITWMPAALIWSIEASLEGNGWGPANLRLLWGSMLGAFLWIGFLSVAAMALSAWVRWRWLASALQFGILIVAAAFSSILNEILNTQLGHLLNPGFLIGFFWSRLLAVGPGQTILGEAFSVRRGTEVPMWAASLSFSLMCLGCVWLLHKRLQAKEVVS